MANYLVVSSSAGVELERFCLDERPQWTLGRHVKFAQIISTHESISRQHAALIYHANEVRWYLCDLRSARSTKLSGRPLSPYIAEPLAEGIVFSLGDDGRAYSLRIEPQVKAEAKAKVEANGSKKAEEESDRPLKRARVEPDKVHASHILVKHARSRNPTSWRQEGTIGRTKTEAVAKIEKIRDELRQVEQAEGTAALGRRVAAIASTTSDCSSAKRGGDLGSFGKGQMQPTFERAAFALAPGELSGVVDSDSGIHLVWRHLT